MVEVNENGINLYEVTLQHLHIYVVFRKTIKAEI